MTNEKLFNNTKKELLLLRGNDPMNDGRTTTTETQGIKLAEYTGDKLFDKRIDTYNNRIEQLARIIDIRHIGSGIWYTSYYGSENAQDIKEKGMEIIEKFKEDYIW